MASMRSTESWDARTQGRSRGGPGEPDHQGDGRQGWEAMQALQGSQVLCPVACVSCCAHTACCPLCSAGPWVQLLSRAPAAPLQGHGERAPGRAEGRVGPEALGPADRGHPGPTQPFTLPLCSCQPGAGRGWAGSAPAPGAGPLPPPQLAPLRPEHGTPWAPPQCSPGMGGQLRSAPGLQLPPGPSLSSLLASSPSTGLLQPASRIGSPWGCATP